MPSPSMITSCGSSGFLGISYSVITTRVLLPVTRGIGLGEYDHVSPLRFTVARYSASRAMFGPKSRIGSRATSRTCGRSTWLLLA